MANGKKGTGIGEQGSGGCWLLVSRRWRRFPRRIGAICGKDPVAGKLLSSDTAVQECDASKADSSTEAGNNSIKAGSG